MLSEKQLLLAFMLATHTHMHTHCATCLVFWSSFRSKLYKVFLEERVPKDERWRREVQGEFVNEERGGEERSGYTEG